MALIAKKDREIDKNRNERVTCATELRTKAVRCWCHIKATQNCLMQVHHGTSRSGGMIANYGRYIT
jgi:hypothetical protein